MPAPYFHFVEWNRGIILFPGTPALNLSGFAPQVNATTLDRRIAITGGVNMDNVRLLKNLYDAFGRGDIPTVLAAMSSSITWCQAESNPYMPSGEAWGDLTPF